ncbi:MAG: alpha/beta hydrolase [Proteobacteria bacterium]|nr:alpha/beta hydrolase [Pseudomonadota bacterium]NOG61665.1 alpha/beta hydrolase [Pseudomonadota bacterium]
MIKTILINSFLLFLSLISQVQAETERNIFYSNEIHELKNLDVYTPDNNNQNLPVLIHIHGGGWKRGDKNIQKQHGEFYSNHNIIFININYRLTPEVKHPGHVEDCAEAVAWVFRNIDKLGGNKDRVFISGHSAGAHLAALLGTDASYLNKYNIQLSQLAGIIPVDTASFDLLSKRNERFVRKLVNNAFGSDKAILKAASPMHHVNMNQSYPDFLIFASSKRNSAIKQSEELSRRLYETGNKARAIIVEGYNHRNMNTGMRESGGPISTEILNFIKLTVL